MSSRNIVLIPAAGVGSRMGGELPKQYLPIFNLPMIQHTVSVFAQHAAITKIYVVLSPQDMEFQAWQSAFSEHVEILHCGGDTRAETVLNGLQAIASEMVSDDWVLVHDAARPCLSAEALQRLIDTLKDDEVGGLLATPVADTLKRADSHGRVKLTESREYLWRAQTPQMFRYGLLKRALEQANSHAPTDEAQAIEALGFSPKLVLGDNRNLKVTYPEDLALAEMLLKQNETKK
jgi:2-C-methyl-D-erythritol 4-phosphate cytidylyltransferase